MICDGCRRPLNRTEEKRRIEFHLVGEGQGEQEVAFGLNVTRHPLEAAHGPLTRVLHRKCWFAENSHKVVEAARAADPTRNDREPPDWRPQDVADVEDLINAGHRDYRGA